MGLVSIMKCRCSVLKKNQLSRLLEQEMSLQDPWKEGRKKQGDFVTFSQKKTSKSWQRRHGNTNFSVCRTVQQRAFAGSWVDLASLFSVVTAGGFWLIAHASLIPVSAVLTFSLCLVFLFKLLILKG